MILALLGVTHAAPVPVDGVSCARRIQFETPYRWSWSAERTPLTEATALLVRADADLLAPRDVGRAVLYVESWPAEMLWIRGDQALILAPLALDGPVRAWFGPYTLPERVDAAARKVAGDEARGVGPLTADVTLPPLSWSGTRSALVKVLAEACGVETAGGR